MIVAIVDDDWALLELTTVFMKKSGHSVYAFSDSEECWEWISNPSNACPDVLITDLMMPYYDGFELVSKIRSQTHCRNMPIVLISSIDSIGPRDNMWDVYVEKPFTRQQLLDAVDAAVASRKQ
ncbi:MAG: response regulator [Chitinispirillaceae bacterium]